MEAESLAGRSALAATRNSATGVSRRRFLSSLHFLFLQANRSSTKYVICTIDLEFLLFFLFSDAANGAHRSRLLAVVRLQHFPVRSVPLTGGLQPGRRPARSEELADQAGGAFAASGIAYDLPEPAVSERRAAVVAELLARGILAGIPNESVLRAQESPERPILSHQPGTLG